MLEKVHQHFSGARLHFIMSRLQLRTGLDLVALDENNRDPEVARRVADAIREICPQALSR